MSFLTIDKHIKTVDVYKKTYGYKIIFGLSQSNGSSPYDTYTMIRKEVGCGKLSYITDEHGGAHNFKVVCRFLGRQAANEKLCEIKFCFIENKIINYNYWFVRTLQKILLYVYHYFFDSWK